MNDSKESVTALNEPVTAKNQLRHISNDSDKIESFIWLTEPMTTKT